MQGAASRYALSLLTLTLFIAASNSRASDADRHAEDRPVPLFDDGTVNYFEYVNTRFTVSPEQKDFARLFLDQDSPHDADHFRISLEDRSTTPPSRAHLIDFRFSEHSKHIEQFRRALRSPWSAKDLPIVHQWLADSQHALDLAVEYSSADSMSKHFHMLVDARRLVDSAIPNVERVRIIVASLLIRANHRLAIAEYPSAFEDMQAMLRIAKLMVPGPHPLFEVRAEGMIHTTHGPMLALIMSGGCPPEIMSRMQDEVENLDVGNTLWITIDEGIRFFLMSLVQAYAVGELHEEMAQAIASQTSPLRTEDLESCKEHLNREFDQVVRAARGETYTIRQELIRTYMAGLRERFQDRSSSPPPERAAIEFMMDNLEAMTFGLDLYIDLRRQTMLKLIEIETGLIRYSRQHGKLPANLDQLEAGGLLTTKVDPGTKMPVNYVVDTKSGAYKVFSSVPDTDTPGGGSTELYVSGVVGGTD